VAKPLRILHLEDDSKDAELIYARLAQEGIACATTRVQSRAEFVAALEGEPHDVVLADFALPGFNGLSALSLMKKKWPDVPFILVSGTVGEEKAIESIKKGATDYVLKDRLARLVPSVRRAIAEVEHRAAIRRAEAERENYSRKLRVLSRRLVEAQETERRNIARELHDQVGQLLTMAQLNLQALLQSAQSDEQALRLNDTLDVVDNVLEQVRDLSLNLRPSMLDDLGLGPALRWYADRQATLAQLHLTIHIDPIEKRLDPVIETECFRIAQEALTNVSRHAKAHSVKVELRVENEQLHLRVRDDGVGFSVAATRDEAVRGASLGLLSMEERAALAGGGLEWASNPGQGTEVHAWFPLKWRSEKN
jgi:two-component system sensor histidine kinase UhpB